PTGSHCCAAAPPSFWPLPLPRPPRSPLFPYTTLFRSPRQARNPTVVRSSPVFGRWARHRFPHWSAPPAPLRPDSPVERPRPALRDRKSTRLNSSHVSISYAVFCLKKKNNIQISTDDSP